MRDEHVIFLISHVRMAAMFFFFFSGSLALILFFSFLYLSYYYKNAYNVRVCFFFFPGFRCFSVFLRFPL